MRVVRIRLLIASLLLAGWLGWLGYLAWTKTNPVVISRSQAMASTHFVLADVKVDGETGQPDPEVTIVEDLRPVGERLPGSIKVRNLKQARIGGTPSNFSGPGPFLLMLTRSDGVFDLTHPPRSPGYDSLSRPQPWAYRWNAPGVREQFDAIVPMPNGS